MTFILGQKMDIYFILVLLFLPSVLGTVQLFTFDSDMLRYVPECNTADFLNCRKVSKLGLKIESNKAIFFAKWSESKRSDKVWELRRSYSPQLWQNYSPAVEFLPSSNFLRWKDFTIRLFDDIFSSVKIIPSTAAAASKTL